MFKKKVKKDRSLFRTNIPVPNASTYEDHLKYVKEAMEAWEELIKPDEVEKEIIDNPPAFYPLIVKKLGKKAARRALRKLQNGVGLTSLEADAFTWASSNVSVATIGAATGLATGVAVGNATITATSVASGLTGTAKLTVTDSGTAPVTIETVTTSPTSYTTPVNTEWPANTTFAVGTDPADDGNYTYSYAWSKSVGGTLTPSADGKSVTVSGTAPAVDGNYIVVCTVTDGNGKKISSSSAYGKCIVTPVTSTALTDVTIALSDSTCVKGQPYSTTVTPTCTDPDDGTYTYSWSFGGASTGLSFSSATAKSPTISGTFTGTAPASLPVRCSVTGHGTTISSSTLGTNATISITAS